MRDWPLSWSTSALLLPSQRCQGKPSSKGPPHLTVGTEPALQVGPVHSCLNSFEDFGMLLCSGTVDTENGHQHTAGNKSGCETNDVGV